MNTTTTTVKAKPDRVPVSALINRDTRDALLQIAAKKDLSLSDVLRAAANEYAKKSID